MEGAWLHFVFCLLNAFSNLAVSPLQDKFHDFMPALDTWAAYIVPFTLITIGLVGIYESCFKKPDEEEAGHHDDNGNPSLALAGIVLHVVCI